MLESTSTGNRERPVCAQRWVEQAQDRIRAAISMRRPLNVEGAGTRRDFGGPRSGDSISSVGYSGIVAYDPSDLVITVRAGTSLEVLEAELARHGQMLGFEPPQRPGSTIGGAIALGWAGPRQPFSGGVRDHLLGVRLLDGRARDLRFGGQVVKNVAGFDVARLMGGSLGILGLLLEVSLRVIPRTETERTTVIESNSAQHGLAALHRLLPGPGLLTAAAWVDGHLYLRSSGSEVCVEEFLARQGGTLITESESQAFWRCFTDQTHPFFDPVPGLALWRVSVPPGAPFAWPQFATALDWSGALRWVWAPSSASTQLMTWASAHGGHAMLWAQASPHEHAHSRRSALTPALQRIHQELANVFDPHRIFNRARMLGTSDFNEKAV